MDEDRAIAWLLESFPRKARAYIATQPKPDVAEDSLLWIHGAYKHVLLGNTKGRAPVRVTL